MSSLAEVALVDIARPFAWLWRGWRDFLRVPLPAAAHGLALALGALVILAVGAGRYWLLAGAFSGFVLVAPSLLVGLYELSRRLEAGEPAGFGCLIFAWRRAGARPFRFGLLLALAGTAWVLASAAILHAVGVDPAGGTGFVAFLRYFASGERPALLTAWILAGGLAAAIIFGMSVVSMPMLLDRPVGLREAVLTSVAAVGNNPVPMLLWACLIMVATLVALATVVGVVVLVPVLGHASWHAYRDLVR